MVKIFILFRELLRVWRDSRSKESWGQTINRVFSYITNFRKFGELIESRHADKYEIWIKQRKNWFEKRQISNEKICFSIIMTTYNSSPKYLKEAIESVLCQSYKNWELIIYDDASTKKAHYSLVNGFAKSHKNVHFFIGDKNANISSAANKAISKANGSYIGLLDHDDVLESYALQAVAEYLRKYPNLQFIYSDEDKLDENGHRHSPYFKSDFDDVLLQSNNYLNHFTVIDKKMGDELGWFKIGLEGAQDHDLYLRISLKTKSIYHIPEVLYSWRQIEGSTAKSYSEKSYVFEAGKKAIANHFEQQNIEVNITKGAWGGAFNIFRKLKQQEEVTIIIPFKNKVELLENCVDSILNKTTYSNFKILLVDNNSTDTATLEYIDVLEQNERITTVNYKKDFNFSAINNFAVEKATSPYVLLLNNDTKIITADWLDKMMSHFEDESVGAVGAELWYEDNSLQHSGVILGIGGAAGHAFRHWPATSYRHFCQGLQRQYSAVTAACLLTKKSLFKKVGGLDDQNLPIALNDIDFCLKLRAASLKVIFEPNAKLYHLESKSRGYEDSYEKKLRFENERNYFINKWGDVLKNDPFYNPNLSLASEDFSLDINQRGHE